MIDLSKELSCVNNVAISGHINPDGDCIGSCLGLYNYIIDNYKDVNCDVYLNPIPGEFNFLKNSSDIIFVTGTETIDEIKNFPKVLQNPSLFKRNDYDLVIVLDCSEEKRVGPFLPIFNNAKRSICIDHHISNSSFTDVDYIIPDYSSTCELIYNILDDDKISKDVAECLYTGIINDTGVFQYESTTSKTMKVAGALMDKGIRYDYIVSHTFFEKTFKQQQALAKSILKSKFAHDNRILGAVFSYEEMQENGYSSNDFHGVCEKFRETKGVEVAFLLYGTSNGKYKCSLRTSSDIDLTITAKAFNGGGHKKAAGFTLDKCSEDEAFDKVIKELEKLL